MSKIDENEILRRLRSLSQVEPTPGTTGRAVKRARAVLMKTEDVRDSAGVRTRKKIFGLPIAKFAAAAAVLICLGYTVGRLSAPRPLDMEELRTALEPAIRQDLLEQVDKRWESVSAASLAQLRDEVQQQVGRDLAEYAAQTIAASRTLTNRRFGELIDLIEAAREQDRRQIEAAFERMELNRRQDKTRLGNGLVALAARTNQPPSMEQN